MPGRIPALLMLLVLPLSAAIAQDVSRGDTVGVPPHPPGSDTSLATPGARPERVIAGHADTLSPVYIPAKSPGLAAGLSALLPGAGQFYNASYWKVPIVVGLGVYFLSNFFDNNRRYIEYRDKYTQSLETSTGDTRMLTLREFYKDERDSYAWYFLILYFANIADAYVDASLYDFNVGGDLSLRVMPVESDLPDRSPQLRLQLNF
jgi:hypothetical protein